MMIDDDKKVILLFCITWILLALLFVFVLGLFDVPFYVEYDESIEVRVSYGRGFEYEEEDGRITAVGWGIIILSFIASGKVIDFLYKIKSQFSESKRIDWSYNPFVSQFCRGFVETKNHKLFFNLCILGLVIFIVAEAMLFKTFLFKAYEQENLGHFTFLNFISTTTHIVLALLIYAGCKKLYRKHLSKNEKL